MPLKGRLSPTHSSQSKHCPIRFQVFTRHVSINVRPHKKEKASVNPKAATYHS